MASDVVMIVEVLGLRRIFTLFEVSKEIWIFLVELDYNHQV